MPLLSGHDEMGLLTTNDVNVERYQRGIESFSYYLLLDDGVPRWQKNSFFEPVALFQVGEYDGVTPDPNTVLNQTNIDNFLGESGVIDDVGFQQMPDDNSSLGFVFKFDFDPQLFWFSYFFTDDQDPWLSQAWPASGGQLPSTPQDNFWRWIIKPLSAGGFALAGVAKRNVLVSLLRDFEVYEIRFYCRLK